MARACEWSTRPAQRMSSHSRNIQWSTRPNRRMEQIYRKGPLTGTPMEEKNDQYWN